MGNDGSKDTKPAKAPPSSHEELDPLSPQIEESDPEFLEQITSDLVEDTKDALNLLREDEDEDEEGISLADINQEEQPKDEA